MSNLIPLEDAARMLGLTVEKLNEMRSNSEIFGYKDGASWKFKMQELERVADELDITINVGATAASDVDLEADDSDDFDLSLDDDDEMSFELSDSSADLLADDSGELRLEGEEDPPALESEPEQESGELSFGASDIHLAGDDSEVDLLDDEPVQGGPSTGNVQDDDDDDLLLSEEDLFDDELTIQGSHEDSIDLSSDFDDSDLILDDSSSSAEVPVAGKEDDSSEISLSGAGLMDLAGAEDDDDDDDMIVLEEPASLDDPTELGDDFNLTPMEELDDEESSSSQVVALDDSEMYGDESAATLLSPDDELEAEPMLTDDAMGVDDFGALDTGIPGMAPGIVPGSTASLPEQPYTVWQIASLGLIAVLLMLGGVLAYDLARNLWLPQDQIISGGLLKTLAGLL